MASSVVSLANRASTASGVWSRIKKVPLSHPFAFGVAVSGVKTSISDLLVQKVVERRDEIDWKRNAAFAAFGFFYLGGVQYALYVPIFGRLFPNAASFASKAVKDKVKDRKGIRSLFGQVFLDQCVHHPLMYFPVFYCTKELVTSEKPDLMRVMSEYRGNMKEDMLALWKVWVPSTLLNFAFMPMWARVPWVAGTSLIWTCILSSMRGGAVQDGVAMEGGVVNAATMKILNEGLQEVFTCPVEMDPSMAHFWISASGPDKAGWVALVAREVAKNGGNVTESKMLRLGHDFTMLMHVAVEPKDKDAMLLALHSNEALEPLNLRVSPLNRRQTANRREVSTGVRIHCVGEDRPGMLAEVAESLVERGMSVENITTELRLGGEGRRDFVINADCTTHMKYDKEHFDALVSDLSTLKVNLGLGVLDVRVHTE